MTTFSLYLYFCLNKENDLAVCVCVCVCVCVRMCALVHVSVQGAREQLRNEKVRRNLNNKTQTRGMCSLQDSNPQPHACKATVL